MTDQEENLFIIQNLQQLITPHLPCDQSRILGTKYSRLTQAGDNYGSTLLRLDVDLVNVVTGEEWTLHAVAKLLPQSIEVQRMFNTQTTFRNEVEIYMTAKPALDTFLKQKGVAKGASFLAATYGGRINLNGSTLVDHNAALVLENLNISGYKTLNRRLGIDFETTQLILKTLAEFHGTTLGLKMLHPKEYNEKVKPFLSDYYFMDAVHKNTRHQMVEVLKDEKFSPEIIERAAATFDRRSNKEAVEPWATVMHNDAWVNNIMIKLNEDGCAESVKLIDFQISEYKSPCRDLLFFLFSSVQLSVLLKHLDRLVDFYYDNLISVLRNLEVDTTIFSRSSFDEELKTSANQSEFFHIACMFYPVLATTPLEINFEKMEEHVTTQITDILHRKRLCYLVSEFDKRGWLNV